MKIIDKICPICSKSFQVPLCHSKRYITCGYICGGIYRTKPTIYNLCKFCNKQFINKKNHCKPQQFCSHICSLKSRKNRIERTCIECNNTFEIVPHRIKEIKTRGVFCSRICQLKKWNRDSENSQCPGSYMRNAWKVYEKKCYDCGNLDERILVIHHIDGNRKNGKIINLIPVCHNCHCIRHIEMSGEKRLPSYRGRD